MQAITDIQTIDGRIKNLVKRSLPIGLMMTRNRGTSKPRMPIPGSPGTNGTNGTNGAPGAAGPPLFVYKKTQTARQRLGIPGPAGKDGAAGTNGTNGANGQNGIPGFVFRRPIPRPKPFNVSPHSYQIARKNLRSGTYANKPAPTNSGIEYQCTDSIYRLHDNGTVVNGSLVWDHYVAGIRVKDPSLASAAWNNQDGATLTTTYGGEQIYHAARASVASLNSRVVSVPTVPYNNGVIIGIKYGPCFIHYAGMHVGWRDSATDKQLALTWGFADGSFSPWVELAYNSSTSYAGFINMSDGSFPVIAPAGYCWWKLIDDNINLKAYISFDRSQWLAIYTIARTSFLANPNQFIVGVNANNRDTTLWWFDYEVL